MIETIVFDVGETLTKDDRYWASWADWLQVPRHTVSALVGSVVAQGGDALDALRLISPDMDIASAHHAREAAGRGEHLGETDLYPDVRPALGGLHKLGVRVVIAGNESARAAELLRDLDLPADLIVTAGDWGVAKPDPAFFTRVLEVAQAGRARRCTSATTPRTTSSPRNRPDCARRTSAAARGATCGRMIRPWPRRRTGRSTTSPCWPR